MPGNGGGRVGAVIESPCIKPGTISLDDYKHFSALRWMEDDWELPHLADAATESLRPFGSDVFTNPECDTGIAKGGGGSSGGGGGGGSGKTAPGREAEADDPPEDLPRRHVPAGKLRALPPDPEERHR